MIRRCTAVGALTGLLDQRQDAPNRENASRWASLIAFGKLVDISTCKLSDVTSVSLNCTKTRLKPSNSHCLNHPEHRTSTVAHARIRAIALAGTGPGCRERTAMHRGCAVFPVDNSAIAEPPDTLRSPFRGHRRRLSGPGNGEGGSRPCRTCRTGPESPPLGPALPGSAPTAPTVRWVMRPAMYSVRPRNGHARLQTAGQRRWIAV